MKNPFKIYKPGKTSKSNGDIFIIGYNIEPCKICNKDKRCKQMYHLHKTKSAETFPVCSEFCAEIFIANIIANVRL